MSPASLSAIFLLSFMINLYLVIKIKHKDRHDSWNLGLDMGLAVLFLILLAGLIAIQIIFRGWDTIVEGFKLWQN